ncbi:uncharacterized protein LOC112165109 isoform X2 [Rosa chinensis]|uniref:uncharacterized protein LOC112165109 isoform X2 n=1 Tax=Rosa chinensis TaxID=74649 RepID=UPI001AD8E303|nr:uncharacterized protein LOC112165109 isoform X2 [Rosa chinensis]
MPKHLHSELQHDTKPPYPCSFWGAVSTVNLREEELIQDVVKVIWSKLHPCTSKSAINNVSSIPSSSSSFCRPKHDVFLSFRGADTRAFMGHLHAALIHRGISTFRDDKDLEKGKSIPKELDKAIEGSKVCVVIVSPDYASSKWCLNELLKILECAFEDSSLPQHHEKAHNLESRYKISKWKASLQNKEDISNHNKRKMVKLSLTVNYDGEWASPVYTGDKTKEIVISDDSTPDELLDQIHSFVGVDPKQNESNTDDNQRIFIGKSLSSSTGFKNPLRNACERMNEVRVLVNYDGEWVNSTYVGGQTKGIVISEDIAYQGLVERVYGVVGVDPHEYKLILKTRYESKFPTQPVEIINDDDLAFFIKENLSRDISSRIPLCTTLERRSFPYGRVESSENSNTAHINRFGTYHSYFHGWTPDPVPYLQQPFYQQQQPSYQQTWTWQPYYKPSYQQLQWGYQQPHHSYMPPQSSCQQPPEIFWHHYQPHTYPPTSYQ